MLTTFVGLVLAFVLGSAFGSFLNVVTLRLGTGKKITGRSECFSCRARLRWFELIPLFSYVFLAGRCRSCGSRLSLQYLLVEFLTGLSFLLIFIKSGFSVESLFSAVFVSLLIIIAVYDFRHKIVPDELSYSVVVLALLWRIVLAAPLGSLYFLDLLAGPIFSLFFAGVWLASRGRAMGLGDAKLSLGLGWWLGFWAGLQALILAFWLGALVGIIMLFWSGTSATMKKEIPFAPFLILAAVIVFFFDLDLISFLFPTF